MGWGGVGWENWHEDGGDWGGVGWEACLDVLTIIGYFVIQQGHEHTPFNHVPHLSLHELA